MKRLLVIALAALSSACVPVYKTLQPSAEVQVIDEQGQALNDAQVTLISSAYPYGREQFRTEATTRGDGSATFYKVKDFRVEVMMLHGSQEFFWNWCVTKPGYQTFLTQYRNGDLFSSPLQVKLAPGESTACPVSPY